MVLSGIILVVGISFLGFRLNHLFEREKEELIFIAEAQSCYANKQYNASIAYATEAIHINPATGYYLQRAFANCKALKYKECMEDMDIVTDREPQNIKCLRYKGYLQMKSNDLKAALVTWNKAAKLGCEESAESLKFFSGKSSVWLKGFEYLDHNHYKHGRLHYYSTFYEKELPIGVEQICFINQSTDLLFLN